MQSEIICGHSIHTRNTYIIFHSTKKSNFTFHKHDHMSVSAYCYLHVDQWLIVYGVINCNLSISRGIEFHVKWKRGLKTCVAFFLSFRSNFSRYQGKDITLLPLFRVQGLPLPWYLMFWSGFPYMGGQSTNNNVKSLLGRKKLGSVWYGAKGKLHLQTVNVLVNI